MDTALVPGSLGALAQQNGVSIAESFLSADVIVLFDCSGSMSTEDSRGGQKRYTIGCQELTRLQSDLPGKIAVVAFSSIPQFVPGGVPPFMGLGTDLAQALRFVKAADGCVTFIVISDGEPDSPSEALDVARGFTSRIDTIYVGPEVDHSGADFLRRLAAASGGRHVVADRAQELANQTKKLMLNAAK